MDPFHPFVKFNCPWAMQNLKEIRQTLANFVLYNRLCEYETFATLCSAFRIICQCRAPSLCVNKNSGCKNVREKGERGKGKQ